MLAGSPVVAAPLHVLLAHPGAASNMLAESGLRRSESPLQRRHRHAKPTPKLRRDLRIRDAEYASGRKVGPGPVLRKVFRLMRRVVLP